MSSGLPLNSKCHPELMLAEDSVPSAGMWMDVPITSYLFTPHIPPPQFDSTFTELLGGPGDSTRASNNDVGRTLEGRNQPWFPARLRWAR